MRNIMNINKYLVSITLILCMSMQSYAQESTKNPLIVKMKYLLINNKIPYILVKTKTKIEKRVTNAPGVKLKIYLDKDVQDSMIANVTTDKFGESVITVPYTFKDAWSRSDEHKFIATTEDTKDYNATNTELDIQKAHIYIDTADDKNIKVVVKKLKGTEEVPVKDVEVKIGVKRSGGDMPVNDENSFNTDSSGTITTTFKRENLVGDTLGNLVLVARTEDNETFGNLRIEKTAHWGVKMVDDNSNYLKRSLYARRLNSPLWLMIVAYGILAIVWGVLLYLVFLIYHMYQEGMEKHKGTHPLLMDDFKSSGVFNKQTDIEHMLKNK